MALARGRAVTLRPDNPHRRLGVQTLNTLLRAGASRPGRALTARLFTPPADNITLPDYPARTR